MAERLLTRQKMLGIGLGVLAVGLLVAAIVIKVSFSGHMEGLYLLKVQGSRSLELTDDVFLGEEDRLLAGLDFEWLHNLFNDHDSSRPHLVVEWNKADGNGYIRNYLGDGKQLLTNFSRYRGSDDMHTHGLFVGGATSASLSKSSPWHRNDSGMTYFDGQEWNHIWCNTNEGIGSTISRHGYAPSAWKFLGSRVERVADQELVLISMHEVDMDDVPLRMERSVKMVAGQPYLDLTIKITNTGGAPGHYFYYYGDEPWLGDFGTSAGDIGWVGDRLVDFEERLDPNRYSFAGMVDYGNDAINEGHKFRHVANFIAWHGPERPTTVFFANQYPGFNHDPSTLVPLRGDSRSMGMYWGPRTLVPGETQTMSLTIGMAQVDKVTGRPIPPVLEQHAHAEEIREPRRAG